MALALYRKYRPATFAEVVGQEHVTEPLCTALAAKRINHAYLFSGPRGCGKTSSARILARSLNCVQGPTPTPCGVCNSCVALAPEGPGSVDVVELDAASHGGVDDARELRDKAFYAPAESRYRVFIIDEAHMVTTQGFNALLKIVEEPPDHLVFVFATTEPDKVLPTIRSRTHHYPFRLIPPGAMRALLERNCADEGVPVEPAVFSLVIRAGGGSARDTQSVMDQLLAGAGPDGVTYERAMSLLGVTDVGLIDDIVDGLAAGDGPAVFGTVDRLVEAGHDPRRFTTDLLERLRDLVLLKAVPDAAERNLVAVPEDELGRMRAQADQLGPATLTRYAEILHEGLIEMRGATAPRLLVELLCARMLLPAAAATDAAVLQRLEGLERRMTLAPVDSAPPPAAADDRPARQTYQRPAERAAAPAPAPEPTPAAAAAPRPESAPTPAPSPAPELAAASAASTMDSTAIRQIWPDLLRKVGERSKPTLVLLQNATVKSVEGSTLVLAMPTAGLARQLAQESRAEVIRSTLHDLVAGDWQVRCVHGDGAASDGPGAARRPATATRTRPVAEARIEPPPATRPPAPVAPPAPAARRAEPDVPPPPEPPAEDDEMPPDPRDEDMTGVAQVVPPPPVRRDPDAVAVDMLTEHLRARRIT
ncbi:MAG TPA: DNA polymerase III subunit gamma and tau [Pseudonocardiaceae bacterium]|nr:DNA polymerase III subunit gamma and tau [Pseudonocardiaceae bacterium]